MPGQLRERQLRGRRVHWEWPLVLLGLEYVPTLRVLLGVMRSLFLLHLQLMRGSCWLKLDRTLALAGCGGRRKERGIVMKSVPLHGCTAAHLIHWLI